MLLNYQEYNNPADIQEVLNNIRTFAVAQGWVQDYWNTDVTWINVTGGFGGDVGNGNYLQLSSSGFGAQNIIVALQHHYSHIQLGARDTTAYTTQDAKPVFQNTIYDRGHAPTDYCFQSRYTFNEWHSDWGWALEEGSMTKQWIFGDGKYIFCIVTIDGIYYTMMQFGTFPEFFGTPTGTDGVMTGWMSLRQQTGSFRYTDWTYHVPVAAVTWGSGLNPWHDVYGLSTGGGNYQYSFCFQYDSREITNHSNPGNSGQYLRYSPCNFPAGYSNHPLLNPSGGGYYIGSNNLIQQGFRALLDIGIISFSGRRPMFKVVYAYQRQSDSVWCPLAKSPFWIINFQGLTPAQEFSIGSRDYIVFPMKDFNAKLGIVFRLT